MTAPRTPELLIRAFLEEGMSELPDRAFDAVRRDIHGTRQRVVVGPWRLPELIVVARFGVAAVAVLVIGIVLLNLQPIVGPGRPPSPTPTSTPSPAATPSGPTVFTSPNYGYTVTLPSGWSAAPALLRWDGVRASGPDAESDKFVGPAELMAWAIAGPFDGDLAALVADRIVANHRDHADTCPGEAPEVNEPAGIGGQPGVLLGWNCGALINEAQTMREGVAYVFVFRDLSIPTARDPTDLELFQSILDSVEFPN